MTVKIGIIIGLGGILIGLFGILAGLGVVKLQWEKARSDAERTRQKCILIAAGTMSIVLSIIRLIRII